MAKQRISVLSILVCFIVILIHTEASAPWCFIQHVTGFNVKTVKSGIAVCVLMLESRLLLIIVSVIFVTLDFL